MPFNIYPGVDPDDYKFPPLIRQSMALYSELIAAFSGKYLERDVANHKANKANPHTVTKLQVGLGNADNTSDANKPLSNAATTALNLKAPLASPKFTGTVSGVSKTMVGLGNVDNTSDASKPVSTAQQTALNLKANAASPAFTGTPTGLTKAHVGLSSVDNTSDANKPISTAQAAAFVPRWKASTAYLSGQQVISPANNIVSALANFTSTATYNPVDWTVPVEIGSVARGQIVNLSTPAALSGIASTETVVDILVANLVIGRRYALRCKFTSAASAGDLAFTFVARKSATTDSTAAGISLDSSGTQWAAPVAGSGTYHYVEFWFVATATETVNIKTTTARAAGATTYTLSDRRILLVDEGAQF